MGPVDAAIKVIGLTPQHRHQSLHGKRRGILSLAFTNLPKCYGVPTRILIERYMRTIMFSPSRD
jgi:hypothetical protein